MENSIRVNGFYWYNDTYTKDLFAMVDMRFESGKVHLRFFNEKGDFYAGMSVEPDQLTPFNPEIDMERLEPRVAEKVKERLEEIAKKTRT